jgi:hypothetical protein
VSSTVRVRYLRLHNVVSGTLLTYNSVNCTGRGGILYLIRQLYTEYRTRDAPDQQPFGTPVLDLHRRVLATPVVIRWDKQTQNAPVDQDGGDEGEGKPQHDQEEEPLGEHACWLGLVPVQLPYGGVGELREEPEDRDAAGMGIGNGIGIEILARSREHRPFVTCGLSEI